jgi:hypothetical protein
MLRNMLRGVLVNMLWKPLRNRSTVLLANMLSEFGLIVMREKGSRSWARCPGWHRWYNHASRIGGS